MYLPIEEFNGTVSIAIDGTCIHTATGKPKAVALAHANQPRSGRIEANVDGKRKRIAISTLLSQYWPASGLLMTHASARKQEYQDRADRNAPKRALQAAHRAPQRAATAVKAYVRKVEAAVAKQALVTVGPDTGEVLKPVLGYEGLYGVTCDGRIWRYPRPRDSALLGTILDRNGHWTGISFENDSKARPYKPHWAMVALSRPREGGCTGYSVPRITYSAWIKPVPDHLIVSMKDGDPENITLGNMELVRNDWLAVDMTLQHRETGRVLHFSSQAAAARHLGCDPSTVASLRAGRISGLYGYSIINGEDT